MQKQLLINGALVALALGTLGVVWATRDVATSGELAARKNQLFQEFAPADVSAAPTHDSFFPEQPGANLRPSQGCHVPSSAEPSGGTRSAVFRGIERAR